MYTDPHRDNHAGALNRENYTGKPVAGFRKTEAAAAAAHPSGNHSARGFIKRGAFNYAVMRVRAKSVATAAAFCPPSDAKTFLPARGL